MGHRYNKPTLVVVKSGPRVEVQPVVVSVTLTPEQRAIIERTTGQSTQTLELTAHELKVVLTPTLIKWD